MGFKDDVRAKAAEFEGDLANLKRRVNALEALAALRRRDPIDGASVGRRSTLDYDAIAFGLSEIKRKLSGVIDGATLRTEHQGAVDYFADVFAKADPQFNRDEFNRLAAR